MIKKALALLLVVIILLAALKCFNDWRKVQFDAQAVNNAHVYCQIAKTLVENRDSIERALLSGVSDTLKRVHTSAIFDVSAGYFVKNILPQLRNIAAIKKIAPLCMDSMGITAGIDFEANNMVIFDIKTFDGFFVLPNTVHYVVYDPENRFEKEYFHAPHQTLRKKELAKDLYYVIRRIYWDD